MPQQYTDETVLNNSLVVECGDKSRYISYNDIYVQETDIYSYTYTTSFDGEGAITYCRGSVTSQELPQVYILKAMAKRLAPTFLDQVEKEDTETTTFSLLTADAVPEEADSSC